MCPQASLDHTMIHAHIAIILRLNPNKMGSLEEWIIAVARECRARRLKVDFYGGPEILPEILDELNTLGANWFNLDLESKASLSFIRRLSKYKVVHLNLYGARDKISLLSYLALPAKVIFVDHLSKPINADLSSRNIVKRFVDWFSSLRITYLISV